MRTLIIAVAITLWVPALAGADIREIKKDLVRIARENKIRPADLLAIADVESNFRPGGTGDKKDGRFRSWGMFQIQTKLHSVSKKHALDYRWAAGWACWYLILRGYRKDRRRGIRRYNGGGKRGSRGWRMSWAYLAKVEKAAEKYE